MKNISKEFTTAQLELFKVLENNNISISNNILKEFEKRYDKMINLYNIEPDSIGLLLNIVAIEWVKRNTEFEGQVRCLKRTDYFNRDWPLIGSKTSKHLAKKPRTSDDHLLIFINDNLEFQIFGKIKKEDYNRHAIFSKFDKNRICILREFIR